MKGKLRQFVFRIRLAHPCSRQWCYGIVTADTDEVFRLAREIGIKQEKAKAIREWAEESISSDKGLEERRISAAASQVMTGSRERYMLEVVSRDPGKNWAALAAAAERELQEKENA